MICLLVFFDGWGFDLLVYGGFWATMHVNVEIIIIVIKSYILNYSFSI